jgi:hypothetical protein
MAKNGEEHLLEICKNTAQETDKQRFADLVLDLGKQLADVYGKKEPESSPIDTINSRGS